MTKKKKVAVKYPMWRLQSSPTPNECLYICDMCGHAMWTQHRHGASPLVCRYRSEHKHNKECRMRVATDAEYREGRKHILG